MANRLQAMALWIVVILYLAASPGFAETYVPVRVDADNGVLVFRADHRMDFGDTGSIEIGVTLPDWDEAGNPQSMTLLSHENELGTRYRIMIGSAGTRIGFNDGRFIHSLTYDFTSGGFFQIGLSTEGDHTNVIINGELVGTIGAGYGIGQMMPLYAGGNHTGIDSLEGDLNYLRFWSIALTQADYARTYAAYGPVDNLTDLDKHVVAWSVFTDKRKELVYKAPLTTEDFLGFTTVGIPKGTDVLHALPPGGRIVSVTTSGVDRVESVYFTVETPEGQRFDLSAAGSGWPAPACPAGNICAQATAASRFELPEGASVLGAAVTYDGDILRNIRIIYSGGTSGPLGRPANGAKQDAFKLAPGAVIDGLLIGTAEGITHVGFSPLVPQPTGDLSGRWVVAGDREPHKTEDSAVRQAGGRPPHGNYSQRMVYVFAQTHRGYAIEWQTASGGSAVFRLGADGRYRLGDQTLDMVSDDRVKIGVTTLTRVAPYPRIDPNSGDFSSFGGTFDLDLQVPFTAHMFAGHDLAYVDPFNFQDSGALRQPVLRAPAADSRDFYPSYQKNIPFGLLHVPDIREAERSETQGMQSADDYTSTLSNSVGVSIGVPKVFSFGASESVQQTRESQASSQSQLAITRDVRTERALVTDFKHAELDPGFAMAVLDLLRQEKLGQAPDFQGMINAFGTHYANALTVGTVSVKTLQYSKTAFGELAAKDTSIEVNASATVRGVKLGAKGSQSKGFSDQFNQEMDSQVEEMNAVGTEQTPVPVFLDLRPLSDLLSPLFFDDPVVWISLKPKFKAAIDAYIETTGRKQLRPEDIWEPYRFDVAVESVQIISAPGNIVGADPTNFYGRIVMGGPGESLSKLLTQLPQGAGAVFPQAWIPGAAGRRQFIMTASDLCAKSPQPSVFVGGEFNIDYSNSRDGSSADNAPLSAWAISLRDLARSTSKTFDFSPPRNGAWTIRMKVSAARLPDPDGGFKDMPSCPR